jgi:hypothetical protein
MPPQQRQLPPLAYQPSVSMPANGVYHTPSSAPTAPMENIQQYAYAGYATSPQYGGQPPQMFAGQQRAATTQSNGNTGTNAGGK